MSNQLKKIASFIEALPVEGSAVDCESVLLSGGAEQGMLNGLTATNESCSNSALSCYDATNSQICTNFKYCDDSKNLSTCENKGLKPGLDTVKCLQG